jgi:hypothetical protein
MNVSNQWKYMQYEQNSRSQMFSYDILPVLTKDAVLPYPLSAIVVT